MTERSAPGYPVPAGRCQHEITVQKSRFLATIDRASSTERARGVIEAVRKEHPSATHHCWAFQAGLPGSSGVVGSSDDGEPHGTAGRPILEVLLHASVGEVVAVVSRWYGGVKLGKGGLARAYSEAVARALESAPTALRTELTTLALSVGYSDLEGVRRATQEHFGRVLSETFGEAIRYQVALPSVLVDSFCGLLAESTAGRVLVEKVDNERGEE